MSSCLWTCTDSERRRSVQKTYAEEVKVHEVDVEQIHGEEIHRVKLTSCFDDLCALV